MSRRNRREPQEAPKTAVERVSKILDVPQNALANLSRIELSSNTEAVIEGYKGILEYDNDRIKLGVGKMAICFTGRNLQIKCMNGESAVLEGFITNIEFIV